MHSSSDAHWVGRFTEGEGTTVDAMKFASSIECHTEEFHTAHNNEFLPRCKVQRCQDMVIATPYGETFANGKTETYGIFYLHITGKKTWVQAKAYSTPHVRVGAPRRAWCTKIRRFCAPLVLQCVFVDVRNAGRHRAVGVICV